MGSLEQQMALFEELISQEQAPTNGILVPGLRPHLVNVSRPAFLAQAPAVVVSRASPLSLAQGQRLANAAAQVMNAARVRPATIVTTVVSRPQLIPRPQPPMGHIVQSIPSLEQISLPPARPPAPSLAHISLPAEPKPHHPHPSRPQSAPSPPGVDMRPPAKKSKPAPRLYERQSESLELKAAIAKATAAANATNTKNYSMSQMRQFPRPGGPPARAPLPGPPSHRFPGPPPPPRGPPPGHHMPRPPPPGPMMGPGPMRPPIGPVPPPGPIIPGMEGATPEQMTMFYASMAAQQAAANTEQEDKEEEEKKGKKKKERKDRRLIRTAAGDVWEDQSLLEWDDNDFRIFVGDLGNECNDEMLYRAFSKYPSLVKVKVIRDKRSNKTKGYGFASFSDANDYIKAMREVNGKYIGNRPCKLRKSSWKDRQLSVVKKKNHEKTKLGLKI